jgi:hypothetical protein
MGQVIIECGGKRTFGQRDKEIAKFREAVLMCEGSEQSRYVSILMALEAGAEVCSDGEPIYKDETKGETV